MFYHLLYPLKTYFGAFNVFRYITFRTFSAILTALALSLIFGPWCIRKLKELQIGQYIREDGPQSHHSKAGTPTMGGLLIDLVLDLCAFLWAQWNELILLTQLSLVVLAALGFYDDYLKVTKASHKGFPGRVRLLIEFTIAAIACALANTSSSRMACSTRPNGLLVIR